MRSSGGATILIVDDEERNRRLFEVLVKADGYIVITAAGGAEAVALALANRPDLILLDLMMPGMDGFEAARQLKNNPLTREIPIAILSSLDDIAARGRLFASGAEELIAKPVDRWKLSKAIADLLKRNEPREQSGLPGDGDRTHD